MPVIWDKEKDPNRTRSQATTPLANLWVNALFGILANQREWHSISSRDKCPRCLDSMKETMNMYNWAVAGQQIDGALCTPFNLKYSSLLMICNSQSKVASFKNKICSCLNKCRMPTRMYTEASFLCRRSTHAYALSIPRVHYVVVSLRCLFNFCSGETRGGGGGCWLKGEGNGLIFQSSYRAVVARGSEAYCEWPCTSSVSLSVPSKAHATAGLLKRRLVLEMTVMLYVKVARHLIAWSSKKTKNKYGT